MAHLRCPAREAQDALAAVPHKRFQDVLAGHWQVDAEAPSTGAASAGCTAGPRREWGV